MAEKKDAYAQDGVSKEAGNNFSKLAYEVVKKSFENSPAVIILDRSDGNFRGLRGWVLNEKYLIKVISARLGVTKKAARRELKRFYQTGGMDGVGTKREFTDSADLHEFAFVDAVGMVAGDQTRYGALSVIFMNIMDVSTLGKPSTEIHDKFCKMMHGLGAIAKKQRFVVFNGETAELGPCVGSDNPNAKTKYNIGGTMIGICHPVMEVTGKNMQPGDIVLAIRETCFRSNGLSSVRKAAKIIANDAPDFYDNIPSYLLQEIAAPSVLSDYFLAKMNGWYPDEFTGKFYPDGVAHISGGGITEKFGDGLVFQYGLSAVLDNLYPVPNAMKVCAEARGIEDNEFYGVWNGGQGVLVVVKPEYVDAYKIQADECGLDIRNAGHITETPADMQPTLTIHSKLNEGIKVDYMKK